MRKLVLQTGGRGIKASRFVERLFLKSEILFAPFLQGLFDKGGLSGYNKTGSIENRGGLPNVSLGRAGSHGNNRRK